MRFDFLIYPEGIKMRGFARFYYPFICFLENRYINSLTFDEYMLNKSQKRDRKIIASLTSYPERINIAATAIKSLMIQTCRPDKIILWLSKEQLSEADLPKALVDLQKFGLEIKFRDGDLKPHKKYYYAMKEFPDDIIITYDDDLIYEKRSIEKLMHFHAKFPDCVICNRGMHITFTNGKVNRVKTWRVCSDEGAGKPSHGIMASTGAGCLYPPSILGEEVFNLENSQKYAQSADDTWMKFMALYNDVKVVKSCKYNKILILVKSSQVSHLGELNIIQGHDDVVLKYLIELYPEAWEKVPRP